MEVLIVDDSEANLETLQRIITGMGHHIAGTARDGQEALNQFDSLHPDVVVMDLIMPRMNGLDALRAIRRRDPDARVVMASSMRSPQNVLECQRDGARYFLHKPFDSAYVRNVINKLAREMGNGGGGAGDGPPGATRAP